MELDFPTNPDEFNNDERISFSKLDNTFIAVHDDGTEFEFDADLKQWLPTDQDLLEEVDELWDGASSAEADEDLQRKRKHWDAENGSAGPESSAPVRLKKKPKPPPKPKQNTAVYVTGLPLDATVPEIHELFSRKGGLIAEEIDSRAPRIKLYKDEAGNFKGDALVVFFKPDSVRMAIMLLDETDFRFLSSGKGEGKMRVQEADSSYKKQKEARRPRNDKDRQKVIKKTQKLDARLADWSDEEDDRFPALGGHDSKRLRTVVLRQMFRIFEIEEDPASLLEIKEDIREECSKLGIVTNVVLYDQEPEGIVTIKFQNAESAAACVDAMNGRPFDGRIVGASLATGKEKFRKSGSTNNDEDSD
ncbi:RNA recognition motif domain-containing protein [Hirsutella rhossiliensis]|uniref:RNA recognition motif domain-containing protein n=1 Tax=Hirsutella rhossiliensis TaxID=111463 RepID=A0A9P8N5I8_9HYPO|nr:RNA recognition motif domain-containing protein [Hirsutella rhossiliensis]KAH0967240.1 RNA recognition motif domain-containing protein [Hirsutella rhossiliensis]